MKRLFLLIFATQALTGFVHAQIDTAPVGFTKTVCLPNSDTFCSVPFVPKWEAQASILGTPSLASGHATITPETTASWTTNQFATLYFVRMLTGAKAGMYYQISGNSSNTLTIDLVGDSFTGVVEGDSFAVARFWTLNTLFPPATQTVVAPATAILVPDLKAEGINQGAAQIFCIEDGTWMSQIDYSPAGDYILLPDAYFIIRHNNAYITASTTFNSMGTVEVNPVSMPLATRTTAEQDSHTNVGRPTPLKLQDSALVSSGAFSGTTSISGVGADKLLTFDNSTPGINKSATKSYYYYTGSGFGGPGWRFQGGGFTTIRDNDQAIPASSGVVIRKQATTSGATQIWTHTY